MLVVLGCCLLKEESYLSSITTDQTQLWHCYYGHPNWNGLKVIQQKNMVNHVKFLYKSTSWCQVLIYLFFASKCILVGLLCNQDEKIFIYLWSIWNDKRVMWKKFNALKSHCKVFWMEIQNYHYIVLVNIANGSRVIVFFQGHLDFVSMREKITPLCFKKTLNNWIYFL